MFPVLRPNCLLRRKKHTVTYGTFLAKPSQERWAGRRETREAARGGASACDEHRRGASGLDGVRRRSGPSRGLRGHFVRRRARRISLHRRQFGLRQDHAAAADRRAAEADVRFGDVQRCGRHPPDAGQGDRLPGLQQGAAALAHGRRQRCAQSRSRRRVGGADQGRGRRTPRQDGPLRGCQEISGAALRRHAAARADRPLAGAASEDHPDGRAVRRARRHHPAGAAGRASDARARAAT